MNKVTNGIQQKILCVCNKSLFQQKEHTCTTWLTLVHLTKPQPEYVYLVILTSLSNANKTVPLIVFKGQLK